MLETIEAELNEMFKIGYEAGWETAIRTRETKGAFLRSCRQCYPDAWICSRGVGERVSRQKRRNYRIRTDNDREYLYDFSAQKYETLSDHLDHERSILVKSIIVAEIEWGFRDENQNICAVLYDFQKILVARADFHVMVFDGQRDRCHPDYEELFNILAKNIRDCHETKFGDTWLLAAYTNEGFVYRSGRVGIDFDFPAP